MDKDTMRAVVMRGTGGPKVLRVEELERPEVEAGRILVKVRAAGVNPLDWRLRRGDLRPLTALTALRGRIIPGRDVAGEVVAVGEGVDGFSAGDRAYAMLGSLFGGYAEYAAVEAGDAAPMPANLSFEEAAAVPLAALTAIQGLRETTRDAPHNCDDAPRRRRVLINGASGGVGHFAVQLAKIFGMEVTAVCGPRNTGFVGELGADHAVDYERDDFTRHGKYYDAVFDVKGNRGFGTCKRALKPGGIHVTTEISPRNFATQLWTFPGENTKSRVLVVKKSGRDLALLSQLFEAGRLRVVVDETFPLEEAAEAHARGEEGHTRGKLVLRVGE